MHRLARALKFAANIHCLGMGEDEDSDKNLDLYISPDKDSLCI